HCPRVRRPTRAGGTRRTRRSGLADRAAARRAVRRAAKVGAAQMGPEGVPAMGQGGRVPPRVSLPKTKKGLHMAANLTKKATLEGMDRIGDQAAGLERAGREPTTAAGDFEGRDGYDAEFLDGWDIPLPRVTGARSGDLLNVRRGPGQGGAELKYEHFSVVMSKSRRMPLLTASNIDGNESKSVPRIKTWNFDGRLDKEDQWGDALYDGNALDRGHMVRREDPIWGNLTT